MPVASLSAHADAPTRPPRPCSVLSIYVYVSKPKRSQLRVAVPTPTATHLRSPCTSVIASLPLRPAAAPTPASLRRLLSPAHITHRTHHARAHICSALPRCLLLDSAVERRAARSLPARRHPGATPLRSPHLLLFPLDAARAARSAARGHAAPLTMLHLSAPGSSCRQAAIRRRTRSRQGRRAATRR